MDGSVGRISSGIKPHALVLGTINFVRRQLPAWRDDSDRPGALSEPELNLQLCKFLDSRARTDHPMVRFNHEENQPGRRRVDLSASPVENIGIGARFYSKYDPFLALECKRLPTPGKDRDKEYVTGARKQKSGGIQRFKLGLHAADLDFAVMIGYVQKGSLQHWHHQINQWISELSAGAIADFCVWNDREKLQELEEDAKGGIASCQSVHDRTVAVSTNELTIHHLWVLMEVRHTKRKAPTDQNAQ